MRVSFVKMHGLGNDFVVLDARERPLPALEAASVRALADRHTGIGCDQLIVLEPHRTADFAMRIFNSDGGEVESCGNAARAVALLHGRDAKIHTGGGEISVEPGTTGARIDMGRPRFDWEAIPLAYPMDSSALPVAWDMLEHPAAVNVGNPHVVFFVEDFDAIPLDRIGREIERDSIFPKGVNVNVATIKDRGTIRLRVWERGAGLTRACGTGACATAVAAIRRNLVDNDVTVHLPGGSLDIRWIEGENVMMSGPAAESFRGTFEWEDFV